MGWRKVLVVVVLVALTSCGATAPESYNSGLPDGWAPLNITVKRMRTTAPDTLLVDAELSPLRMDDGSCAGHITSSTTDEGHPEVVWAYVEGDGPNTLADPSLLDPSKEHGVCPIKASRLELRLEEPIDGRRIVVNSDEVWVPADDGAYVHCLLPACNPDTGKAPLLASCADKVALVDDVRNFGDVGKHASIGEDRCQDRWAMVEVDIGAAACGPGGSASSCAGRQLDRLFLKAGVPHWAVITRTRDAGCGNVAELEPDYPLELCKDRPAILHP